MASASNTEEGLDALYLIAYQGQIRAADAKDTENKKLVAL